MSQIAVINPQGVVLQVVEADEEFVASGALGDPAYCIPTDVNSVGGASVGFTYNPSTGKFYPPSPMPSWVFNDAEHYWEPPVPYPVDGKPYRWDEATLQWVEQPIPSQNQ